MHTTTVSVYLLAFSAVKKRDYYNNVLALKYVAGNTRPQCLGPRFPKMVEFGLRISLKSSQYCSKIVLEKGLKVFTIFVQKLEGVVLESENIFQ